MYGFISSNPLRNEFHFSEIYRGVNYIGSRAVGIHVNFASDSDKHKKTYPVGSMTIFHRLVCHKFSLKQSVHNSCSCYTYIDDVNMRFLTKRDLNLL